MKKENFRNGLHYLIGGIIAFGLCSTFAGVPLFAQLVITVIVVSVIGFIWEVGWHIYNNSIVDKIDIIRGVVGALFVNLLIYFIT